MLHEALQERVQMDFGVEIGLPANSTSVPLASWWHGGHAGQLVAWRTCWSAKEGQLGCENESLD